MKQVFSIIKARTISVRGGIDQQYSETRDQIEKAHHDV